MQIKGIDEIIENSFAHWSSGLFYAIKGPNPDLTFEEHKEAFFWLLKKLLDEGKVRLCYPADWWKPGLPEDWDGPSDEIIEYVRERFPKDATHEDDSVVNDYFYDSFPPISWLGEDGKWYGS
jgi:hypothetical protein